jgi:hypothetical protein
MMTCHDVSTLIATGGLSDAPLGRKFGIRMHLAMCRHCRVQAADRSHRPSGSCGRLGVMDKTKLHCRCRMPSGAPLDVVALNASLKHEPALSNTDEPVLEIVQWGEPTVGLVEAWSARDRLTHLARALI